LLRCLTFLLGLAGLLLGGLCSTFGLFDLGLRRSDLLRGLATFLFRSSRRLFLGALEFLLRLPGFLLGHGRAFFGGLAFLLGFLNGCVGALRLFLGLLHLLLRETHLILGAAVALFVLSVATVFDVLHSCLGGLRLLLSLVDALLGRLC